MTHTTLRTMPVILLTLALFSLASVTWAGPKEEVREIIRQKLIASDAGDAAAVVADYAEDAQVIIPGRVTPLKGRAAIQQFLEHWYKTASNRQYSNREMELRVYHNTVVVLYRTYTVKWVSNQGRIYEKRRRVTSTRVKRDGQWQMVSAHVSDLPQ